MSKPRRASAGFTLLEVLIAVLIVGIIATAVVPLVGDWAAQARIARLEANLRQLDNAVTRYNLDHKAPWGWVHDPNHPDLYVPYDPPGANGFAEQLERPTDLYGNVLGDPVGSVTGSFSYGPYTYEAFVPIPASILLAAGRIPTELGFKQPNALVDLSAGPVMTEDRVHSLVFQVRAYEVGPYGYDVVVSLREVGTDGRIRTNVKENIAVKLNPNLDEGLVLAGIWNEVHNFFGDNGRMPAPKPLVTYQRQILFRTNRSPKVTGGLKLTRPAYREDHWVSHETYIPRQSREELEALFETLRVKFAPMPFKT